MARDETKQAEPYRVPAHFNDMTIHHLYGVSEVDPRETFMHWFARARFGFLADLNVHSFKDSEIEAAVNGGSVRAAHWPQREPSTDFLWTEVEGAHRELLDLADKAVELCYGQDAEAPAGGDFATVGAQMGSQPMALAGLIYAREQGRLREITEMSGLAGPLYVVRGSFSAQMFDMLLPEEA